MAVIVNDTFTEASNTTLASHTPDTGGTWYLNSVQSARTASVSGGNGYLVGDGVSGAAYYYNNSSPASAEYDVVGTIQVANTTDDRSGIFGRASTSAITWYQASLEASDANNSSLQFYEIVNNSATFLGSYGTYAKNNPWKFKLEIKDASKKVYEWSGGSWVERLSDTTHNNITATGKGGLKSRTNSRIDDFQIIDSSTAGSPSASPSASPSGSASASPSASPSGSASASPSASPSGSPSASPSASGGVSSPSVSPSASPSGSPSGSPSASASASPSSSPSASTSASPSASPSGSPSASPSDFPDPPFCDFKPYVAPLVDVVASTWESAIVGDPQVFLVGGTYYMFYWGYNGTNACVGYATSSDLTTWTKYASNPVMSNGAGGTWDSQYAHKPYIIKVDTTYYMVYEGFNGTTKKIGLATSTDLITWTKSGSNPILSPGTEGNGDTTVHYKSPTVYKKDSTYYMYYAGQKANPDYKWRVYYATSTDLVNWTKIGLALDVGSGGQWDDGWVTAGEVIVDNDQYLMTYNAGDATPSGYLAETSPSGCGFAVSYDLINWTKFSGNPVIASDTGASREQANLVWKSRLTYFNSQYRIFFNAGGNDGKERIFYAPTLAEWSPPSPSASPSGSASASPSVSPSASPSGSPSASPSASVSGSASASPSASVSSSASASPSGSPSASPSASVSSSPSASASASPSASASASPSASSSASPSSSPSASVSGAVSSPSASPSASPSSSESASPSASPSGSASASPSASVSSSASASPSASVSSSASASPSGSPSASPSGSPSASPSGSPSASVSASASASPSASVSSSPSASPSGSASASPSGSASASPSASVSASPSASASASPSASVSSSPSASPSGSASASPSASPSGSASASPSSSTSASPSASPSGSPSASASGAEGPDNTYIVYQNSRLEIWVDGVEVVRFKGDGSIDVNGAVNQNAF